MDSSGGGPGGWTAWAQGQRGASSRSYHSQQGATSPPATSSGHSPRGVNGSSWEQGQYGAANHSYPHQTAHRPAAPAQPVQPHVYSPSAPQGPEEDNYDGPSVASPNWQEKKKKPSCKCGLRRSTKISELKPIFKNSMLCGQLDIVQHCCVWPSLMCTVTPRRST